MLVFLYTLFSILHFNVVKTRYGLNIVTYRIWDVWTIVGGAGDLFISFMLWFIIDSESESDLIKSGESIFEVKQVIANTKEVINDYDEDDLI